MCRAIVAAAFFLSFVLERQKYTCLTATSCCWGIRIASRLLDTSDLLCFSEKLSWEYNKNVGNVACQHFNLKIPLLQDEENEVPVTS